MAGPTRRSFWVAFLISESCDGMQDSSEGMHRLVWQMRGWRCCVLGTEEVPMVLKMQEDKAVVRVENMLVQA